MARWSSQADRVAEEVVEALPRAVRGLGDEYRDVARVLDDLPPFERDKLKDAISLVIEKLLEDQ